MWYVSGQNMPKLVVTYQNPEDPPVGEMDAIEKKLVGVRVLDRFPGSLLVEGKLEDVIARISGPEKKWIATQVQSLQSGPANKTRKLKG